MSTRTTTSTLTCDVCGSRQSFSGETASRCRIAAKAAGWRILGTTAFCTPAHQVQAAQPRRAPPNRKSRRKAGA